jgi:outer membrane biosynthesis protein TonB
MADLWYYAHGPDKTGPFSGRQLKELAASGRIVPGDTIWKDGIERGVPASKVKNLFPASPPPPPPAPAAFQNPDGPVPAKPIPPEPAAAAECKVEPKAPPAVNRPVPAPKPVRKGRAVVVKGAVITYQDGSSVKYRKKCSVCGFEDHLWNSMPILGGTTTSTFFCPKCRKVRPVEIQGFLN